METIKSLVNLKNSLKNKRYDFKFSKKLDEFEKLIIDNPEIDDKLMCFQLYGKKNITTAYKSLKYRMEERLLNEIFEKCSLEDDLKTTIMPNIQIEKLTIISSLLHKNFFRKEAIALYEKSLNLSKKYSAAGLALKQLLVLLNHYSFVEPNKKNMNKINADIDYYTGMLLAEIRSKQIYAEISNLYTINKAGFNKKQLNYIYDLVKEVHQLKLKYKTNYLVSTDLDLMFFYFQSTGDFKSGLNISLSGLNELYNLEVKELLGIYQTKKNIAICHFILKNHEESSKWFNDTISMVWTSPP